MKAEIFEKKWKEIEDNFDWNKVYQTMKLLGWHWQNKGIPSISELKKTAYELLKDAVEYSKEQGANSATVVAGGFRATCEDGYLSLEFILTSYDVY
jgi:hypothetical protein